MNATFAIEFLAALTAIALVWILAGVLLDAVQWKRTQRLMAKGAEVRVMPSTQREFSVTTEKRGPRGSRRRTS